MPFECTGGEWYGSGAQGAGGLSRARMESEGNGRGVLSVWMGSDRVSRQVEVDV